MNHWYKCNNDVLAPFLNLDKLTFNSRSMDVTGRIDDIAILKEPSDSCNFSNLAQILDFSSFVLKTKIQFVRRLFPFHSRSIDSEPIS